MTFPIPRYVRFTLCLFLFALLVPGAAAAQPDTLFVDTDANAAECGHTPDGTSWPCAYPALQDAFDEVNDTAPTTPFEIWVAGGTYYPDVDNVDQVSGDDDGAGGTEHVSDSRDESFTLTRDDVEIFGGFDGTDGSGGGTRESDRDQRDPDAHPVILSGDVDQDNALADNAYHVVRLDGRTSTGSTITNAAVLDGLTVRGGNADGPAPNDRGGGLYCDGSDDGAGGADECSPVIQRVRVDSNRAEQGAGLYVDGRDGTASPTIRNASFRFNNASAGDPNQGGAISNDADGSAGGVTNTELVNVTFFENVAGDQGGAIMTDGTGATANVTIVNCTFAGNSVSAALNTDGDKAGTAVFNRDAALEIINTVIWDHTSFAVADISSTQPFISHSLVENGLKTVSGVDYDSTNLDASPRYVGTNRGAGPDDTWGTSDDDLRRNWASALIDNGDPSAVPNDGTDLDGDGNTSEPVPDLGLTARTKGRTVDIGAFERGGVAPTGGVAHVDQSASGAGDGSSWSDAYVSLQAGLRANENAQASSSPSDVTEVRVATGTYVPTRRRDATDARSRTFFIDGDSVEVFGGFPSGGGTRDPDSNPVVLSGDLDTDDDIFAPQTDSDSDDTTPTQTDHLNGANAYNVLFLDASSTSLTDATIIDGVSVTAGNADGSSSAAQGGGLHCSTGSGHVCSPTLRAVTFFGNHATTQGGALYNDGKGTASPTIRRTIFRGNAAGSGGGAIANDASNGGAASPVVANAVFTANASLADGGALWNVASNAGETASPTVTVSSFTGNTAEQDGGALYVSGGNGTASPTISNVILWSDTAAGSGDEVAITGSGASADVSFSIVQGGCPSGATCGDNLLTADPQFASAKGGDGILGTADDRLQLQGPGSAGGASPAIDAGDNTTVSATEDLGGTPRKQDVPEVSDTGNGTSPIVDMGAFESDGSPLPVELSSINGSVDDQDAVLTWKTASETNNAGFQVQRKRDGAYTDLEGAFVESKAQGGTTNQPLSYRYRVTNLDAGEHTFRLKQVDTDGSASFSDPIDVNVGLAGDYNFTTYPNPVSERATVEFAVKEKEEVTIALYNTLGQRVKTIYRDTPPAEQTRQIALDTDGLSSGLYILRLQSEGVSATQRISVVK